MTMRVAILLLMAVCICTGREIPRVGTKKKKGIRSKKAKAPHAAGPSGGLPQFGPPSGGATGPLGKAMFGPKGQYGPQKIPKHKRRVKKGHKGGKKRRKMPKGGAKRPEAFRSRKAEESTSAPDGMMHVMVGTSLHDKSVVAEDAALSGYSKTSPEPIKLSPRTRFSSFFVSAGEIEEGTKLMAQRPLVLVNGAYTLTSR
jgi:hypothetical protein